MTTASPFPNWETDASPSSIHNHPQWCDIVTHFRFAEIGVTEPAAAGRGNVR
jgi:hypothetical protein